ncbi:MAG TPA: DUF2958 domain-containing protein [bacterium]|nr:DUF2958 domain-containing protein [bacterium]
MRQKLFTKEIEKKLKAQYPLGSSMEQEIHCVIFNPYGRGTWYIMNQDPEDPDYLWAIVELEEVEMGSVSKSELENARIPLGRLRMTLERDLYWKPKTAREVWAHLNLN